MNTLKTNFKTGLLVGMNLVLVVVLLTSTIGSSDLVDNTPENTKAIGADPFLGEITMFAGNFAPRGYAFCHGQLLAISQNQALFSILGTTYGGDGRTSFALPDLRGRAPIQQGQGPGLSNYRLGQKAGSETVTLTAAQLPAHGHGINIASTNSEAGDPNAIFIVNSDEMSSTNIGSTTGGQSFSIVQPYLAVNYIIALQGTFPSRN